MLTLRTPSKKEFSDIQNYIRQFELDDRNLQQQEFIAAFQNDELLGFGRLRKHSDCNELCSLGVVIPQRKKGIGKAIVQALLQQTNNPIYLVCIIPEFFSPLGFQIAGKYPLSIQEKLHYCTHELVVPETYVVMSFNGNTK